MHGSARGERSEKPRICMPTFSAFARHAFRARLYEAQDVLSSCDDVELIELKPNGRFAVKSEWMQWMVYHDLTRKVATFNPGLQPVRLLRDYDLFLVVCGWWADAWYANAIQGWRDRCRTSICWIDELWAHDVPKLQYWLPMLDRFDYVIVGTSGSTESLAEHLGRPCYEILSGVDAIRFTPYPDCPRRVIDLYSIGRAVQPVHQRFLKWSEDAHAFYIHDSMVNLANREILSHAEHRNLYANLAKRSRLFAVAPGKFNVPEETHGQVTVGARYFEGSAAGSVLIGQVPECEGYRSHFDWPEAVVEIQPDGSDTTEVISKLLAEPDRLREMSRRNAVQALRRHDWAYRWKQILDLAGLTPRPAMAARERRLAELAQIAESGKEARLAGSD